MTIGYGTGIRIENRHFPARALEGFGTVPFFEVALDEIAMCGHIRCRDRCVNAIEPVGEPHLYVAIRSGRR